MPKAPRSTNPSANRPKRPIRPLTTTDLVLTPGGMRPRNLVHQLEEGQHVRIKDGRLQVIDTATGAMVKDLGASSLDPGEPAKLVKAEEGASKLDGLEVPTALPDLGWIVNAQWHYTGPSRLNYFSTTWTVPPAPTDSDTQTIYLFNALEPEDRSLILQPVLQWGVSAAGGGEYWSITNWLADGQHGYAIHKPPVQVAEGTVLTGLITYSGVGDDSIDYKCVFVGYPAVDLLAEGLETLTWAYETLEAYGTTPELPLTQCGDYPNINYTAMYDIELKTGDFPWGGDDVKPDWATVINYTDCGQTCRVLGNDSPGGEVDLFYSTPTWQQLDNNPACVAIVADGPRLYQRHNDGAIWEYIRPPMTGWLQLDYNSDTDQIAAGGGSLYQLHGDGTIWKFVGPVITGWQQLDDNPAAANIIAAGDDLYQRHDTGLIWKYVGPPLTGWENLDNNPATIEITADGDNLYQLHQDGSIWAYTGPALTGWQQLDNNPAATAIAASGGHLYQLHNDGGIWEYVGPPMTGWQQLDNNPACIAIAADGDDLYQLHNPAMIWKYVGPPFTGWQNMDRNPATVAITASGGTLYQLQNNGSIWRL